jgi:hypothetical protein
MENQFPSGIDSDRVFYSKHFMDPVVWEPFVHQVCRRHRLGCNRVIPGVPGTFPTFLVELQARLDQEPSRMVVVKFFGPLFDGPRSFHIEREMGKWLSQQSLPICSPDVLAQGQLNPTWSYLIFEGVQGVSIRQANPALSAYDWDGIAVQVGAFIKSLHMASAMNLPRFVNPTGTTGWSDFTDFLDRQQESCQSNHLQWGDLPPQLVSQVQYFLLPTNELLDLSTPPHLIHADLTGDHLLGRMGASRQVHPTAEQSLRSTGAEWETLAIIDWGDTRIGNVLYELVALHLDLFTADRWLLSICLERYELPDFYRQSFAHKALCMALLHQFPLPAWVSASHADIQTLDELAVKLFTIDAG